MAFPSVANRLTQQFPTASTTHDVTLPTTVNAGDLLLIFFVNFDTSSVTAPSNWTLLSDSVDANNFIRGSVYKKEAGGSEGGSVATVTLSSSVAAAALVYRITDWSGGTGIEISAPETPGNGTAHSSPQLVAPWGTKDNLWLSVATAGDDDIAFTGAPANFSNLTFEVSGAGNNSGCEVGAADLKSGTDTQNPGDFTLNGTEAWALWTIVVEPLSGAGTVSSINKTIPLDAAIYQRTSGNSAVSVEVNWSGSPTSIEARAVNHGTNTEVVTWTVIDSSPGGSTADSGGYAGTLTIPTGGWYGIEVRFGNETSVNAGGADRVAVGDVIGLYGQSQMQDFNDGVFSAGTFSGVVSYKDVSASLNWTDANVEEPLAELINNINTASGVPTGVILGARSGARISQLLKGASSGYYSDFVTALQQTGAAYVFFNQGGGDIKDGLAKSTYRSRLDTLYTDITADVSGLKFGVQWMARRDPNSGNTGTDASIHAIRSAQIEFLEQTAGTLWAGSGPEFNLRDAVHYTELDQIKAGERIALAVLKNLGFNSFDARGPSISSISENGSTVTIFVAHDSGSNLSLLFGTSPQGIEVLDNGSVVGVSSWTVNTNSITAELTSAPSGTITARHGYGGQVDADQSNVIDNAAHSGRAGLPLRATTSEIQVSTVTVTLNTENRSGGGISDQSGVEVWVSSSRDSVPEIHKTNLSISGGQLTINVNSGGYSDSQVVFVEAKLSTGEIATAEGSVVVS